MKFTRTELKKIFVQKAIQELGMEEQQTTLEELKALTTEDYEITRLFDLYEKLLEIQRDYTTELKYNTEEYGLIKETLQQQINDLQETILNKTDLINLNGTLEFEYKHKTNLYQINYTNQEIQDITEELIDTLLDSEEWKDWEFKDLLK